MFGLVRRAALTESERRRVNEKLVAVRLRKQVEELEQQLRARDMQSAGDAQKIADLNERLEACEAERQRLLEALFAKTRPAEIEASAEKTAQADPEAPRMLSGLEAVTRAMEHRNKRHVAVMGEKKS